MKGLPNHLYSMLCKGEFFHTACSDGHPNKRLPVAVKGSQSPEGTYESIKYPRGTLL